MNEWITDRRPTAKDAHDLGYVWVTTEHGNVLRQLWNQIGDRPWMPTARPEPYVKPKRWEARWNDNLRGHACWSLYYGGEWQDSLIDLDDNNEEHREAAERIAAIYQEVMP